MPAASQWLAIHYTTVGQCIQILTVSYIFQKFELIAYVYSFLHDSDLEAMYIEVVIEGVGI